jgi:carboxynorspermidine decarboxylase
VTPAFVYDETNLLNAARLVRTAASDADCQVLYAVKAFAIIDALRLLVPLVDGFAVSSVFEAALASEILGSNGTVHLTSPGLREEELETARELCDYVSFNSLSQWVRFQRQFQQRASCGLRINPQFSLIDDNRFDPCREGSKLGVPVDQFVAALNERSNIGSSLDGLHFHTNCDSTDFEELHNTVALLERKLGPRILERLQWMNMGGGYLFTEGQQRDHFCGAVALIRKKYGLQVFIEPGASLVREAGYLVSTVVDIFSSSGQAIAVLDTTVNHLPEVFEYQFEPDVLGHSDDARYAYTFAGGSCLAGDVFGEYSFDEPLAVGSRVVFENIGAYSLVKAHMFNGINLPTIYARSKSGGFVLKRRFGYDDFISKLGC